MRCETVKVLSMARGCAPINSRPDTAKIASAGRLEVVAPGCLQLLGYQKRFHTAWVKTEVGPPETEVRGRDASYLAPTGSPEAVAHPRLPQNVACGFTALRSSAVDLQHCKSLQLRVTEAQLWSQ